MSDLNWPIILSTIIFILTYVGILAERIHRTLVTLVGAIAMICVGTWLAFYSPHQAVESTDPNTIALLFGMMVIVSLFQTTGFFEYLAIHAVKLAKGRPWLVFVTLGLATTVVSMLLDNVTTIILMIPVTMSLTDILGVPMTPFLIGEVMLSNIGGVATLIGDPPNIMIGSAANLTFTDFIVHLAPIVLVTWAVAQLLLLFLFRRELTQTPSNLDRLMSMDAKRAITDGKTARKMLIVLAGTMLLFFVHGFIHLESGTVAVIGASIGLVWLMPEIGNVLKKVHWDVLLFFIGLFIIVGGLEAAGTLDIVAEAIAGLTSYGMVIASLAILWTAAIMSAIVDNVPFTIAMLPILVGLGARGVDVGPLWWALSLGVGFGGNATPVGATANVICMSFSEKTDSPISTASWIRKGLPTALLSCTVASILMIIAIYAGLF